MRNYIGSLLEMVGTWYFVAAGKLYHWAGAHYHCARLAELADIYEHSLEHHYQLWLQHERARNARAN